MYYCAVIVACFGYMMMSSL